MQPTRLRFIFALLTMLAIGATQSMSAEISVHQIPGETLSFVSFEGEIASGDAARFSAAVDDLQEAIVILESPGGLVREALQIGAAIRLQNFSTMVAPDAGCYSTCGLLWLAGLRRYMSPSSRIGFHAAYREENGEQRESGMANAEIGSFLTHLGLRIEAIRFFTVAGPDQLLLLTPDRARALGVEIYELRDGDLVTPDQIPTVDRYVDRFVAIALLRSRCAPFFRPLSSEIEGGAEAAFEKGKLLVGDDHWVKLMTQRLESMKQEIDWNGALLHCINTEADLRRQGLSTGIDGPSFRCSEATLPTEYAICADADVWAKDRAMNAIYLHVRKYAEISLRKRWLVIQREWLQRRNDCGWDKSCINRLYDQRLEELREIDLFS